MGNKSALDRFLARLGVALVGDQLAGQQEIIMGRLDTISQALTDAGSAAAAEHEQVMAGITAAAEAAAALQASVDDLTAKLAALGVSDEEIAAVQEQADAVVQAIKDIDPDAVPEPEPEPEPTPEPEPEPAPES